MRGLLVCIALLIAWPALATTTDTFIIDPGEAAWSDYGSLQEWESAEACDLTAIDKIYVAECICTNGTADGGVTFSTSWTTDATRYIKVWTNPDSTYRHNGTYQTGNKYRIEAAANCIVATSTTAGQIRIEGLQLKDTGLDYSECIYALLPSASGNYMYIDKCVFVGDDGTSDSGVVGSSATWASQSDVRVTNSVFYGFNGTTGKGVSAYRGTMNVYNCTFHDCTTGLEATASGMTATAKNNIAQACGTGIDADWDTEEYNIADDGTATGTGSITGVVAFADSAATPPDFRLSSSDTTAKDAGTDLSAIFTDDIEGDTRSGTWDIGADEIVAAAPTGFPQIIDAEPWRDEHDAYCSLVWRQAGLCLYGRGW